MDEVLIKHKQVKIVLAALMMVVGLSFSASTHAYAVPATWTSHPASNDTASWRGVTWVSELGLFVSVGTGATGVMTSPDGINWTPQTTPDSTHTWRGIAWSPQLHLLVAVGSASTGTTTAMTSPNGVNWTLSDPGVIGTFMGITWSPDQARFVVTAAPASGALVGEDNGVGGITWTSASTPPIGGRNVVWSKNDGQYVSGRSPTATTYTSPDGLVWTSHAAPIATFGMAYSETNDVYVAVGSAGIISSNDGANWTTRTSPVTNLRAVIWSPENDEFAAVGPGGIVTSPDGITWTARTSPSANTWDAITWSPQTSRYVATSIDGTNRTMVGLVPIPPTAPLNLTAAPDSGKINLSWTVPTFDGNSAITGYRIERSISGGAFSILVANTASAATTYVDANIVGGTAYSYRVYALNAEGQSVASNTASVQANTTLAATGIGQHILIVLALAIALMGIFMIATSRRLSR